MIYHHLQAEFGLGTAHRAVIAACPSNKRVLDLGCSTGYVARALERDKKCRVVGVELDASAATMAVQAGLTVIPGSLSDESVRKRVAELGPYGAVICADILEHLENSDAIIDWIRGILRDDGVLILSVPNVANYTIRKELFFGRFNYTDRGILDRTHLRFFTARTLRSFLVEHQFCIDEWGIAVDYFPVDRLFAHPAALCRVKTWVNEHILRRFPNLIAFQFVVTARPKRR